MERILKQKSAKGIRRSLSRVLDREPAVLRGRFQYNSLLYQTLVRKPQMLSTVLRYLYLRSPSQLTSLISDRDEHGQTLLEAVIAGEPHLADRLFDTLNTIVPELLNQHMKTPKEANRLFLTAAKQNPKMVTWLIDSELVTIQLLEERTDGGETLFESFRNLGPKSPLLNPRFQCLIEKFATQYWWGGRFRRTTELGPPGPVRWLIDMVRRRELPDTYIFTRDTNGVDFFDLYIDRNPTEAIEMIVSGWLAPWQCSRLSIWNLLTRSGDHRLWEFLKQPLIVDSWIEPFIERIRPMRSYYSWGRHGSQVNLRSEMIHDLITHLLALILNGHETVAEEFGEIVRQRISGPLLISDWPAFFELEITREVDEYSFGRLMAIVLEKDHDPETDLIGGSHPFRAAIDTGHLNFVRVWLANRVSDRLIRQDSYVHSWMSMYGHSDGRPLISLAFESPYVYLEMIRDRCRRGDRDTDRYWRLTYGGYTAQLVEPDLKLAGRFRAVTKPYSIRGYHLITRAGPKIALHCDPDFIDYCKRVREWEQTRDTELTL